MLVVISATLIVSLISFSGIFLLFGKKNCQSSLIPSLVSLAAGVLLGTAFGDLMPEAIERSGDDTGITLWILGGVVIFFLMERMFIWFHHHASDEKIKPVVPLILLGDSFHNFLDGIAIAAAFSAGTTVGVMTTLAVIAHEVPHEIGDLALLIDGGMSKRKAIAWNFVTALTAVAGGIIGYVATSTLTPIVGILLAVTCGNFIYIACSDLIPSLHEHFHKNRKLNQTILFLFGIIITLILKRLVEG
ncbi:hypothetical protein A3D77_00905 [Candidatus Gottesmanbacteria bacterium RIFCSPHIGHO2_02_FULL_39_11]|uniref:Zinc/iron permease n=1 Tax=Candidatus Gottesmanbacteria bacterium RIFCSPHIGHO2_02_FULL_39_11 TaxID=1798382 RepID=A0A1F5ZNQ0_9BACT|nr:MAG: hypothetical protein A3D77_00905 [Candidatus Gottesmanbacteria bacterium RIFCSPHIGHO2_02_FULL_39_11]